MTKKGLYKLATKPHIFLRDYVKTRKDKKEKIKVYVEKIIDINIPSHRYYYTLFLFFNKTGFYHTAEKALDKAISLKSKAVYHYKLGVLLKRKSQWWQMVETLGKAIEMNPTAGIEWHLAYVEALEKMNRFEEALVVLKKFAKNETLDSDGYFIYGNLLKKTLKEDEAQMAFSKAIKLDTSKENKELGIGVFYEKKGRWIEALEAYKEEVARQPENALIYYKLGLSYDRCYDWKNAEASFVKAISMDTTNAHWFYRLGFVRERQSKWKEAEEAYNFALERQNNFYPSWYYRLGFVLEKQGKYQESTVAFKEQRVLQDAHGVTETTYNKNQSLKRIVNYTEYYERYKLEEEMVLYESFHGSSMSCNPYAMFKLLLKDKRFKQHKHIWVINDTEKIPKNFKDSINVIFIKRDTDLYMRYLAKAKYLVNNVTFPEYFIRKEGQIYLNTWHGTPIKSLGKDIKDDFMAHKNVTRNFLQASHLLQPNAYTTNILLDRYDVKNIFSGVCAEIGYPRQDLMLNITNEEKTTLKKILKIPQDKKVVLYAPTWRGAHGEAVFDTSRLENDLEKISMIEDIHLLFRGHHMIEDIISTIDINATVVPSDIDTNTLLSLVDILLTDYSSIAFDYMALEKPIIYYAYDRKEYEEERGFYFALEELGGELCSNQEELLIALNKVVKDNTIDSKQKEAQRKFCSYDDGEVTKRAIELIFFNQLNDINIIEKENKKSILLYGGPFIPNGITTSFLNLLNHVDTSKYSVSIVVEPNLINSDAKRLEQFNRINNEVSILGRTGNLLTSLEEKWNIEKFSSQYILATNEMNELYLKSYTREFKRIFGEKTFDSIINFEGYKTFWTSLFSIKETSHQSNSHYLHNDMYGEWKLRFPYLEKNFRLYKHYDSLVSVSKQTMEHNKKNLSSLFNLQEEKFSYCDNVQNPEDSLEKAKKSLENKEDEKIFDNTKVFINIARLSPEKDQEKLVKAFKKVSEKYSDARLINLGSGPLESYLKSLIKELNLEGKVFFLGQRSNPYPYLAKSDCFVLSSNHEGQPMTLFEAMILEKPIIATDIVGNRSVLEGRQGLLVDNSKDGLEKGMLDFLEGRYIEDRKFDYETYNKEALEMFYQKVVGEGTLNEVSS